MTTNDTKALLAELREIRKLLKKNTEGLRLLVKLAEKQAPPEFVWPPAGSDDAGS
jgi:hypothetical protein